ncbi:low molecular weight protein-tyrosine-phosphatase [Micromonospora sp. NPDC051141]|uniref:low molecular weight protein-tyrosine-phosphatase n=1 Tax=Micromonospora sp. NPDC051141 TaxID=3364284 RepID=UPI00379BF024
MPGASPRKRILVVCLGNHCRSPLAAAILTSRGHDTVTVRSAALHAGRLLHQPAHPLMVQAAEALGHDISSHRGTQLTAEMLHWADSILAMDRSILGQLHQQADPEDRPKVTLYLPGADVPDPWGKSPAAFTASAAMIEQAADHHLR